MRSRRCTFSETASARAGVVALVLGERRLDARLLTRQQPVAAVQHLVLVLHDGVAQTVLRDVGGRCLAPAETKQPTTIIQNVPWPGPYHLPQGKTKMGREALDLASFDLSTGIP
jgi:hypothetical protein